MRGRGRRDEENCDFCDDSKDMVSKMQEEMKSREQVVKQVAPPPPPPQAPSPAEVGRSTWTFLHVMAAAYPESPDDRTQREAFSLLKALGTLYPCRWCREDWSNYIMDHPPAVQSRHDLEQWMCQR